MTTENRHSEKLLIIINKYKRLPIEKQEELKPLYDETIARHKRLQRCSKIIDRFVAQLKAAGS